MIKLFSVTSDKYEKKNIMPVMDPLTLDDPRLHVISISKKISL